MNILQLCLQNLPSVPGKTEEVTTRSEMSRGLPFPAPSRERIFLSFEQILGLFIFEIQSLRAFRAIKEFIILHPHVLLPRPDTLSHSQQPSKSPAPEHLCPAGSHLPAEPEPWITCTPSNPAHCREHRVIRQVSTMTDLLSEGLSQQEPAEERDNPQDASFPALSWLSATPTNIAR